MSDDDTELYNAWQGGDKRAGQALIERYYDPILRFFRTKVGTQADDLIQKTFLVCSGGGFRGDSTFRAYLFGIARNVLFEFFRSKRRDAKVDPDVGASSCHELDPGPSTMVAKRAEQRLLVEALRRIPLEIQMTLELFYWEDVSVTELADILAIPEGTVKSRLHRGRALLKEAIGKLPATREEQESVRVLLGDWAERMQEHVKAGE